MNITNDIRNRDGPRAKTSRRRHPTSDELDEPRVRRQVVLWQLSGIISRCPRPRSFRVVQSTVWTWVKGVEYVLQFSKNLAQKIKRYFMIQAVNKYPTSFSGYNLLDSHVVYVSFLYHMRIIKFTLSFTVQVACGGERSKFWKFPTKARLHLFRRLFLFFSFTRKNEIVSNRLMDNDYDQITDFLYLDLCCTMLDLSRQFISQGHFSGRWAHTYTTPLPPLKNKAIRKKRGHSLRQTWNPTGSCGPKNS